MNSNVREIFYSHLGYLLAYSGKSQNDVARDLGVATGTVSSWVNGQKFPRADMVQKLSDYLGVRMSVLMEENGLDAFLREESDRELLNAYHAADPSIRSAVRKLLDLPSEEQKDTAMSVG